MTHAFPTPNANVQAAGTATPFYIVGVGASAGGLEAAEKFFDNMRPDSGMAFVVIQQLSPDFKCLMDEFRIWVAGCGTEEVAHSIAIRRYREA